MHEKRKENKSFVGRGSVSSASITHTTTERSISTSHYTYIGKCTLPKIHIIKSIIFSKIVK